MPMSWLSSNNWYWHYRALAQVAAAGIPSHCMGYGVQQQPWHCKEFSTSLGLEQQRWYGSFNTSLGFLPYCCSPKLCLSIL
ncbi:hypothetical protein U1Q18_011423 [Sarracenia purpurea var. burkii]